MFGWKFDEGLKERPYEKKDMCYEYISGSECAILGVKSYWKKGVSGTALAFDGYYSGVIKEEFKIPSSGVFTIESWISVGAYSWRWSPIIHQSNWGKSEFYFGIDYAGRLGLMISTNGKWQKLTTDNSLDRFKWIHAAGVINCQLGEMSIYINGEMECSRKIDTGNLQMSDKPLLIGLNNEKLIAANAHREWTYPSLFGFDGLIDEVKVYGEALIN